MEEQKLDNKNLVYGYAVGDIQATVTEVQKYIFNFMLPHRIAFSAKTDLEREEIETINDHCKVFYVAKRLPPPLNPRDLCVKWIFKNLKDGRVLISASLTDHRHVPLEASQAKGYVRMRMFSGAILLVPTFNGMRCTCKYVLQSDPGGYIPPVITNSRIKLAMSIVWESKVFFAQRHAIGDDPKVVGIGVVSGEESELPHVSNSRIEEILQRRDRNKTISTVELKQASYSEWIPFDR